jgi:hypothetical protein
MTTRVASKDRVLSEILLYAAIIMDSELDSLLQNIRDLPLDVLKTTCHTRIPTNLAPQSTCHFQMPQKDVKSIAIRKLRK